MRYPGQDLRAISTPSLSQAILAELLLVYIRKFGDDSIKGGPFGESDLDAALFALSEEEIVVKSGMAEASPLTNTKIGGLETIIESYLADIRIGIEWLDSAAHAKDESAEYFVGRRKTVRSLVENATLRREAGPEVALRLNLSPGLQIQSPVSSSQSSRGCNFISTTLQ